MSAETNATVVRRFIDEAWNAKNPAIAEELLAPTYRYHGSDHAPGPAIARELIVLFATAFPDARATIDDLVADETTVAIRWTTYATHLGDFGGLPPTDKKVQMNGMEFFRLVDGRITERWSNSDTLGLLQQLGVVSPA